MAVHVVENNISSFMLEMKETAFICSNATSKSLVLFDELGRATSNEDGVAIAWAISEFLLKKGALTFFVTHYPQLYKLGEMHPSVQNQHLSSSVSTERTGDIRYTHKVTSGPCTATPDYGVGMATACGWPIDAVEDVSCLGINEIFIATLIFFIPLSTLGKSYPVRINREDI